MIKFFSKIRQNLLTSDHASAFKSAEKFTRYPLHALGEILLVMIGILLALQVNNWNEMKEEFKMISQLMQDEKLGASFFMLRNTV